MSVICAGQLASSSTNSYDTVLEFSKNQKCFMCDKLSYQILFEFMCLYENFKFHAKMIFVR